MSAHPEHLEKQKEQGDITDEFLSLNDVEFKRFLFSKEKETNLIIKIDINIIESKNWPNIFTRLKAFIEYGGPPENVQLRRVIVTGTKEQKREIEKNPFCLNALQSGIEWDYK